MWCVLVSTRRGDRGVLTPLGYNNLWGKGGGVRERGILDGSSNDSTGDMEGAKES